jgi:uncharacterized phiE125 gp8 family phage protein
MTLTIRTPPAEEPISLAAAKQALRVGHSEEEGFIATLAKAAREAVEQHAGIALVSRAVRERLDRWPSLDGRTAVLALGPVSAVEAVRIGDSAGTRQPIDPAHFELDGAGQRPRLIFRAGMPTPATPFQGIEIDYIAGFGAASVVPAALQEAVLITLAAFYEKRSGETPLPPLALGLMAPFARVRL